MGVSHKKAGDKMARFASAGLVVPVTGFANAMTSAALEFKREGLVVGLITSLTGEFQN